MAKRYVPFGRLRKDAFSLRLVVNLATILLDRLDRKKDWQFLLILYLGRWVVLSPLLVLYYVAWPPQPQDVLRSAGSHIGRYIVLALLVAPLLETLIECALPYAILRKWAKVKTRPWSFITLSALMMMALHPYLLSLVPAFVTGMFLAYTYAHFAHRNNVLPLLYTALFHAGINIIGVIQLLLS